MYIYIHTHTLSLSLSLSLSRARRNRNPPLPAPIIQYSPYSTSPPLHLSPPPSSSPLRLHILSSQLLIGLWIVIWVTGTLMVGLLELHGAIENLYAYFSL